MPKAGRALRYRPESSRSAETGEPLDRMEKARKFPAANRWEFSSMIRNRFLLWGWNDRFPTCSATFFDCRYAANIEPYVGWLFASRLDS
jgi:hypothetical protein